MFIKNWAVKSLLVATIIAPSLLPIPALAQASRSPVAPRREVVAAVVQEAYDKFKNETRGKNADYIPYLAQVDSKLFGIAIVTTDNQVLTMGDVKYSFSIQSISKVYTLALAMEALGADKVFQKVGSEPTGRPFNSPVAVVDMPTHTGNPFVNAGAIATTSLISGKDADEKWNKILDFYSRAAGEKLILIDEVYKSEAATNNGTSHCAWWKNLGSHYVGLKFNIQGKTHYGWARVKVVSYPQYAAILTGYACETIPNKPIVTGKTKGPDEIRIDGADAALTTPTHEPARLGLLAMGSSGLSIWRREEQLAAQ
jgi:hypothetical protein